MALATAQGIGGGAGDERQGQPRQFQRGLLAETKRATPQATALGLRAACGPGTRECRCGGLLAAIELDAPLVIALGFSNMRF